MTSSCSFEKAHSNEEKLETIHFAAHSVARIEELKSRFVKYYEVVCAVHFFVCLGICCCSWTVLWYKIVQFKWMAKQPYRMWKYGGEFVIFWSSNISDNSFYFNLIKNSFQKKVSSERRKTIIDAKNTEWHLKNT